MAEPVLIHEGPWPCEHCKRFHRINAELRGRIDQLEAQLREATLPAAVRQEMAALASAVAHPR